MARLGRRPAHRLPGRGPAGGPGAERALRPPAGRESRPPCPPPGRLGLGAGVLRRPGRRRRLSRRALRPDGARRGLARTLPGLRCARPSLCPGSSATAAGRFSRHRFAGLSRPRRFKSAARPDRRPLGRRDRRGSSLRGRARRLRRSGRQSGVGPGSLGRAGVGAPRRRHRRRHRLGPGRLSKRIGRRPGTMPHRPRGPRRGDRQGRPRHARGAVRMADRGLGSDLFTARRGGAGTRRDRATRGGERPGDPGRRGTRRGGSPGRRRPGYRILGRVLRDPRGRLPAARPSASGHRACGGVRAFGRRRPGVLRRRRPGAGGRDPRPGRRRGAGRLGRPGGESWAPIRPSAPSGRR